MFSPGKYRWLKTFSISSLNNGKKSWNKTLCRLLCTEIKQKNIPTLLDLRGKYKQTKINPHDHCPYNRHCVFLIKEYRFLPNNHKRKVSRVPYFSFFFITSGIFCFLLLPLTLRVFDWLPKDSESAPPVHTSFLISHVYLNVQTRSSEIEYKKRERTCRCNREI